MNEQTTRLTKSDLQAIETEALMMVGDEPTLETISADIHENTALIKTLDAIAGVGRIVTLLVAETIQSFAAIIIAIVFAIMEFQRVEAGAVALGQQGDKAILIALALVTANVVHPIYSLRQLRGQTKITSQRQTLRGYWDMFWDRIAGKPSTHEHDVYHNNTLHIAAFVITWSTILLAIYDILSPLMTEVLTGTLTRPAPIAFTEFIMGSLMA